MGQTALASFLPLYLSLHLKLPAALAGAYMSILFLFAGIAPALVGWISDRYGHLSLIMVFSLLSGVCIVGIPYLGSGAVLVVGLGALGALLWALRPVVVSAAMSSAPPELSGRYRRVHLRRQYGSVFFGAAFDRRRRRSIRPARGGYRHRGIPYCWLL